MTTKLGWTGGLFGKGLLIGFAALWIGLWTAATLSFDVGLVTSLVAQLRALSFPTTEGVVIDSRIEVEHDSESGSSYTPIVEYEYTVARHQHRGRRLQYQWSTFGKSVAQQTIDRYPAGSSVRVYYNPRDPAASLLQPGLNAGHGLIALFMTPFNLIMLGCWVAVWQYFAPSAGRLPWGVSVQRAPEGQILRLNAVPPLAVAATWTLGLSFAGVFVAAFGSAAVPLGFLVGLVWIVVIGGSLWAYLRQRRRARLLTIDDFRGTLSLGDAASRRPVRTAAVRDLQAVAVRQKSKLDSDGDMQQAYAVAILKSKPASGSRNWCLVSGWSQPQAQQLADWLGTRLRLPVIAASS